MVWETKEIGCFKNIVTVFALEGPKYEIIQQGMSYSVKQDVGSHSTRIEPWDRLGLASSVCSLL